VRIEQKDWGVTGRQGPLAGVLLYIEQR